MGNWCCVQVKEATIALKEKGGKFEKKLGPGCHCVPRCFGHAIAGHISMKTQQLQVRAESKTQDNLFVSVVASIHYKVASTETAAYEAFYLLSNPNAQIQAHAFQLLNTSISGNTLDVLFATKDSIADALNDSLKTVISPYGYEIVKTMIVNIAPEEHIKRVMNMSNTGITRKEAMEILLVREYHDTMKEIGATSKSSAVFIPHGTQVKEGFLQATGQL